MRKLTRVLSLILSIAMLVGLVPMMTLSSSAAFNDPSLKFDENGDFVLIQISDIQDNEEVDETTLSLIAKAMTRYSPDMVVLTGDNVNTKMNESKFKSSVDQFMAPIIAANVRYAVTFGNHDSEGNALSPAYARQDQYNYYISKSPLAVDFDENSLSGVGTGSIPIYSNDGSRVAFCVFPMDSGDYDSNGDYDHVKADQIAWYESESARLATLNNNNPVPTLVFQHIPVPEIYDTLLVEAPSSKPGSVQGTGNWKNKYYVLDPNNSTFTGVMKEGPCPSAINGGQYDSWRNTGNMVGAFYGHDHTNTFKGTDANGITMGYCKAATLNAYNDGDPGLRVFTIHDDGTYDTQSVAISDLNTEEAGDYEHDTIAGTPTVPKTIFVGAADNSLSKQEYGSYVQLQSVNHKTQALYPNDLAITIDLANTVTDVTLAPPSGISISAATTTAKDENTNTYTWHITGGTASAGTTAEFAISYNHNGNTLTQRAYSYVDNIKSPAGHYVFTRLFRGGEKAGNFCTNLMVMTVLGETVYGKARSTTDIELTNTYAGGTVGSWTNAPAGYYNYLGSEDSGFVTKDTSYGLNYCSPSRVKIHNTFPRFTQAGASPQATVYADTSVVSSLTDLGVTVNYWRCNSPDNGVSTQLTAAFKSGDVGYEAASWDSGAVSADVIGTNGTVTLVNPKGSNAYHTVSGSAVPENGSQYTMVTLAQTVWNGGDYDTTNYTYCPVLFSFVTYTKAELRTLLNAERQAMRQPEGYSAYSYSAYISAYKEAYKQINKTDTNQAAIDAAYARLQSAITELSSSGAQVSNNSEYQANITVPSRIYVAGSGYGLTAQPTGTQIQTKIINYQTGALIDYTNFSLTLPEGATDPAVTVESVNGAIINYTWDPQTKTGVVTGGTVNVGDIIRYNFTYSIGAKTYTQTEASAVAAAPTASGWLTYIRRFNGWWTNQGCQETINFFAIAGVPVEGVGINVQSGNSGNDNASNGMNLTVFSGTGDEQKPNGTGICSWTGPTRYNTGTWYCGQTGANSKDNGDGGYRAVFDLYLDSSAVTEFSQANLMYRIINLRTQDDFAEINESSNSVLSGAVAISDTSTYSGITFGEHSDTDAILADPGDSYYRMMQGSSIPNNGDVITLTTGHHNNYSKDLTCKYGWTLNIKTVDKSSFRSLVAAEDEFYRQISDGYDNSNGTFTAYLTALAKAKGSLADPTKTALETEAAEAALQEAIANLTYLPADYTALRAKVDSVRIQNEDGTYSYRPYKNNDPVYYATNEFYPWNYFRSTNELDIPIDNIDWNLDIRYQAQIDGIVDVVDTGWESVYLNGADYTNVDAMLLFKDGINDSTGSIAGNTIRVNPNKYGDLACSKEFIHWSNYTTDSYQDWEDAVIAGSSNRNLKSPDQAIVDGYAATLQTAYEGLTLKPADYTALDDIIEEVNQNTNTTVDVVDPSDAANNFTIPYYSPAYVAQIQAEIDLRQDGLYIVNQADVDALHDSIEELYIALGNNLNAADYTFANEQKNIPATYEDEYARYYTTESWNALATARAAIRNGKMAGEQGAVNTYALNIYNARNNLVYNPADYSQVNYYLDLAGTLTPDNYTNWAQFKAAIDAVVTGKNITEQAAVDTMAANLKAAYEALNLKEADYTALEAQLTAAAAIVPNQALYTTSSYSTFDSAYTAAQAVNTATPRYNILQQATVDNAANSLEAAIAGLEYLDATIQPLADAIVNYSSVDQFSYEEEYGESVWTAVQAAYDAAQGVMDEYDNGELDVRDNQRIIDTANALNAAVADLPALYQPVTDAKAEIPEDLSIYTDESVAALDDVLDSIDYTLKIGRQDDVYTYADNIYTAIGNLVTKTADLDALIAAITAGDNEIDGVDTSWYTSDSWDAFEDAYNAAVDIRDADPAYDITAQADVDAATAALVDATNALEYVDADYTALDKAVEDGNALDESLYTPESWASSGIEAALAAAEAIPTGLKIDSQDTIDAAAEAVNAAIAALELLPQNIDLVGSASSSTIIDTDSHFIYGLVDGDVETLTDLVGQGYCDIEGEGYLTYTYYGDNTCIGTGTRVDLYRTSDDQLLDTYYVVIFGDNDGDGFITLDDMTDCIDYYGWNDCIHEYEDFTDPNAFAMDIDGDGIVTYNDLAYITDYLGWNLDYIPQAHTKLA